MRLCAAVATFALLSASLAARADSVFNFESTPSYTELPLSITNNGLTATFTGGGEVCNSGGLFGSLSGQVLIQGFCGSAQGNLAVAFDKTLSSFSFNFASAYGVPLTVDFFENGTQVWQTSFTPGMGPIFPEGVATGAGAFNSIELLSESPIAIDNLQAVAATPEPSSLALLGTTVLGAAGVLRRRLVS